MPAKLAVKGSYGRVIHHSDIPLKYRLKYRRYCVYFRICTLLRESRDEQVVDIIIHRIVHLNVSVTFVGSSNSRLRSEFKNNLYICP